MFTQMDAPNLGAAKDALRKASDKLPLPMKMVVETNN